MEKKQEKTLEQKLKEAKKKRDQFFEPIKQADKEIAGIEKQLREKEAGKFQDQVKELNIQLEKLDRADGKFREKDKELGVELKTNNSSFQKNRGEIAVLADKKIKLIKKIKELLNQEPKKINYVFKESD